jgi:molecular chaperone DnaK (HSP70)
MSYHVGIDLGTTHTVVAYAARNESDRSGALLAATVLPLPQLVSPNEIEALRWLPSFLYAPAGSESVADPWQELPWLVGQYARQRGQEVSERLVASGKSWLSHAGVARRDAILPWAADDAEVPKISPIEASRRLLAHVRRSWEAAFAGQPLSAQSVVLTVPASFDEVARELTVEAAELAGLTVRLLEEPQAAFYDLIGSERRAAVEALLSEKDRARVLVCDVGGGTTDLTLIEARRSGAGAGELELERIAVGRHLLLGGDNIDLALAQVCEQKLMSGERLDPLRFSRLLLACRAAKETLLGRAPAESVPIRLASLGSSLVGGTLATELTRSEVETLVFDGFLPLVERGEATPKLRAGLLAFGLPYERDPAISRHIVQFLERHAALLENGVDALLLNGGLFHAERAAERVRELISRFAGREVTLLPYPDPDLSVARGAVAYSRALAGQGLRIAGGTARGFYVAVDERAARRALCVVPKGAREGERHAASTGGLWLRVGQPVQLELYTSDSALAHRPGDIVTLDDDFEPLPPVTAVFSASDDEGDLEVALEGELSAAGTVELSSVELSPSEGRAPRRFRLAFELRARKPAALESAPPSASRPLPARLPEALEAIRRVFGEGRADVKPRESKDLPRELERLLGERRAWTLEANRSLFDALCEGRAARRRSEDHERVFWMLSGYCLRPGFGAPLDEQRIAQLVPLFEAGIAGESARSWQQFWIAWRRVVAGLRQDTQTRLLGLLEPFIAPSELKLKRSKSLKPADFSHELLELAASLERVPAARRVALGDWLIERTYRDRDPRLWSALGRVGARVPGYGSAHHVVPARNAESWLDHLLRERWHEVPTAAATAAQLARRTDDRARDIADALREEVIRRLEAVAADAELIACVRDFVPLVEAERAAWFGEELPVGLRLKQ